MADLSKFGISAAQAAGLTHNMTKYPETVSNRVAHIDADFMAYQVSAESKAELDPDDPTPRKTLEEMRHNAKEAVDHIRKLAGAERAVLHTTANSDKGGRERIAIQQPYQENRKERTNRPEYLDYVREFLGKGVGDTTGVFTGLNHTDQEADDGMAQAAYTDPDNNIVCSKDKDLTMVPGLRLDLYTNNVWKLDDGFGSIELVEGKTKKLKGYGTKFFWAQVLMGDPADYIKGLPECPGSIWQEYDGTKGYYDALEQYTLAKDPVQKQRLLDRVQKMELKTKKVGPVLAYNLLNSLTCDKDCFELVKECFVKLAEQHGYTFQHWQTGKLYTPTQVLLSEMKLLWMRRTKDENDVLHWIKGHTDAKPRPRKSR